MVQSSAFQKIIRLLRKSRLSVRLIAAFLIISLLPSLVLALFSNRIYSGSISGTAAASVKQSLQLLNNNANLVLGEYSNYLDKLSLISELQEYLYARNQGLDAPDTSAVRETLSFVAAPKLRSVVVLDVAGEVLINKGYASFSMDDVSAILAATDAVSPKDYVTHCLTADDQGCVAMCRKVYDHRYSKIHVGYILLFLNNSLLSESVLPTISLGDGADTFIVNSVGQPVAFRSNRILEKSDWITELLSQTEVPEHLDIYAGEIADRDNLVVYVYSSKYDLYMFSVVPYTSLNREVNWVKTLVLTVTLLLLVICLALSLTIYFSVITPVNAAVAVCQRAESVEELSVIQDKGQDELALMSNSIDSMIISNRRMMADIRENGQRKRELEIEMLKLQLNPHFLFNTLNTFKWIADINCLQNLRDGISSLADLLRSTLVQKQEFITLGAEIDNLKSYCTIQNLRYAGQFEVRYCVDEAAPRCLVPRFILQPLIENAVIHATKNKEELLHITVSCCVSGDSLTVEVRDDGAGFDTSKVFDTENDRYRGIGLSNVDDRLRLYYGAGCRLTIRSAMGEGTVCTLSLPAEESHEEAE